jgi:polyribonucleotide nucleotidyltransferase
MKKYTIEDFSERNEETWNEIENLPLNDLEELYKLYEKENQEDNNVEAILMGIEEITHNKKSEFITNKIKSTFSESELEILRDVVLQDRDITWDFFRNLLDS